VNSFKSLVYYHLFSRPFDRGIEVAIGRVGSRFSDGKHPIAAPLEDGHKSLSCPSDPVNLHSAVIVHPRSLRKLKKGGGFEKFYTASYYLISGKKKPKSDHHPLYIVQQRSRSRKTRSLNVQRKGDEPLQQKFRKKFSVPNCRGGKGRFSSWCFIRGGEVSWENLSFRRRGVYTTQRTGVLNDLSLQNSFAWEWGVGGLSKTLRTEKNLT